MADDSNGDSYHIRDMGKKCRYFQDVWSRKQTGSHPPVKRVTVLGYRSPRVTYVDPSEVGIFVAVDITTLSMRLAYGNDLRLHKSWN